MNPASFQIRQAGEGDLAALCDLYQFLLPGDARPTPVQAAAILRQFQRYEGSAIFLLEEGARLCASCTLVVVPNLTRGGTPYGLIENVVTHPDARRRGHGKAVLRAAVNSAWETGCYKVMLMTGSRRPGTLAFYADVGFEQSKTGFQIRRIAPRDEV